MKTSFKFLTGALYCFILMVGFTACENDDPQPDPVPQKGENGVFILNQGRYSKNNAGVTFFNLKTGQSIFDLLNGGLGDTGQSMIRYGGKLYIAMYNSSNITVLDVNTKLLVKRIPVWDEKDAPRQPRQLASYEGKVYASTFDGNVVKLDTASLNIEAVTKVGPNPEGIAAVKGKLYVANSNGMSGNDNYGTTLSIVDIATFKEEKTLTVGINPSMVHADSQGDVYLNYLGVYNKTPGGFQRIDTKTNTVTTIEGLSPSDFTIEGDYCYFYSFDDNWTCSFGKYNVKNETKTSDQLITDGTKITTAYGIGVDPDTKDVYISDTDYTSPGKVYIFGTDGKKKNEIGVGINACSFAFY